MVPAAKVVLITGCSAGGIGHQFCNEFAKRGCKVYATARNIQKMDGLRPEIEKLPLDVNNVDSIQTTVKHVLDREGKIDILVNNAGFSDSAALLDTSIDAFKSMFETNAFSVLRMVHAVVPHMAERKSGLVLNVSSIAAYAPRPFNGTYSATKAALNSMSDTLDMELSPLGIRVFLLCPGYIKTQLAANDVATSLPPNSLYGPWRENIRQNAIGVETGMPVDQFARKVVDGALASTPARYMSIGKDVGIVSFFRWMPRSFQLFLTWFKFGKPMEAPGHHTQS